MTSQDDGAQARQRTAAAVRKIRLEIECSHENGSRPNTAEFERTLTELRRLSTINAHWGIIPTWPIFGRFEVLGKRAMRILLRWYINPIIEQQNAFNLAVLASLYEFEAQLHEVYSNKDLDTIYMKQEDAI